ncbi:MAG TPA: PIN domain-containing protein [Candidatus Eisenbacteria bacterium]|nr:PIN domain-containing protein [Candidatus Eisenbacteria bacterium]
MEIRKRLARHRRIALDTCAFIYQMEWNPKYFQVADAVFEWIERHESSAVTSTVALTEILVQPYRIANSSQAEDFYSLLTTIPNLEWIAPSLQIANSAASLRATYRLGTPDALIASTAIFSNATALVTNDAIFKRVPNLDVLLLDEFL